MLMALVLTSPQSHLVVCNCTGCSGVSLPVSECPVCGVVFVVGCIILLFTGRLPLLNMAAPLLYAGTYTPAQYRYIAAAFRVGMLAMETLARRVHDDRPQTKYARNPPYGEDVKWLLTITIKMGEFHFTSCWSVCNA